MKRFSIKSINIILGVCIFVVSVVYLIQTNSIATKGYKIKELEQEILELKQKSKDLEGKALEMQSVKKISERINSLNMIIGKDVQFLSNEEKEVVVAH